MRRSFVVTALCLLAISTQAGILVQFRTVFGNIDVELFEKDKPITVSNFVRYVQSGKYQNSFIHRCDPAFVIQGGAFYVANRGTTGADITNITAFASIPNEYGSGSIRSNRYGTVAMAKLAGQTNSATSSWFFNLYDNFFLDAHDNDHYFTVFGQVVGGTNVLNVFRTFSRTNQNANIIFDGSPYFPEYGTAFSEWPFLTSALTFDDLVYVDISLLNVQIKKLGTAREISWNSVTGKVNRVEFTTNLPPVWNSLVQTNPTTSSVSVQDTSTGASRRFYRVRVEY